MFYLFDSILIYLILQRPDTYVDLIADQSGFLLPHQGTKFIVKYDGLLA